MNSGSITKLTGRAVYLKGQAHNPGKVISGRSDYFATEEGPEGHRRFDAVKVTYLTVEWSSGQTSEHPLRDIRMMSKLVLKHRQAIRRLEESIVQIEATIRAIEQPEGAEQCLTTT